MKRLLAILFCAAALGAAQTEATTAPAKAAEEQPKWLQKVFDLKYADPAVLADLLSPMHPGPNDRIKSQTALHVLAVGTYDQSFLQLVEEIVKRYDVPAQKPVAVAQERDIEVIAHILVASHKGVNGDAVPDDLSAVAKQLRSVFGYTDIKLLDSAVIRGRAGSRITVSGQFGGLIENYKQPIPFFLRFTPSLVLHAITLKEFAFSATIPSEYAPGQWSTKELGFNTDLSVAEGQKVVVGKSRIGTEDKALILVLSARSAE